jgi:hypothetical protein
MPESKRIPPTNDLMFKKLMASEENKDILSGLITDVLGIIPEDLTIISPYSIELCRALLGAEDVNKLRYTLRDVAASFKAGDFVSELQIRKTQHFHERLLYYPLKRFCENYGAEGQVTTGADGKPNLYSSLRPVFALNILEQSHYSEDDDALRVFELYDPIRNKRFGKDLLKIGCFELNKVNIETENQKHWRDFFVSKAISVDAPVYIKKANEVIDFVNLGEEERQVAEALEKAGATLQDELDYSYFSGKAEGMLDVLKMLKQGKSIDEIMRDTGLSLAEV